MFLPAQLVFLFSLPKMCQSSPGGQSSCSSEPSPLGSTNNNDSGVEMNMHSGGSLGDLTALDDNAPVVDSTVSSGNSAVSLQLRKHMTTMQRLEQLKKEKLKTVKDSCSWVSPAPQARNTKLPPISGNGKSWAWTMSCRNLPEFDSGFITRNLPWRNEDHFLLPLSHVLIDKDVR